ncbi:hypothetical protein MNBD_ALPHA09-1649 [hydrothermal vent metagenome]|uniref:Uncharacterized protein n=1 Tax=hydrothermal vent metagenome TaxID=652676 RepID=A0A3B0TDS2_9ZZZZ
MRMTARIVVVLSLLMLQACAAELARNPVPQALAGEAQVANMPQVRYWGDALAPNHETLISEIVEQIKASRPELRKRGKMTTFQYLAISGGGGDGAFGAGLLVGWSAAGTRAGVRDRHRR